MYKNIEIQNVFFMLAKTEVASLLFCCIIVQERSVFRSKAACSS